MKIDISDYEVKKYYILVDEDTGDEVIELDEPREVLFDGCSYLALGEGDWEELKSKLGITKSDDEVTFEDVVGEYDGMCEMARKMGVERLIYTSDDDLHSGIL